jgi:hypothetical protein
MRSNILKSTAGRIVGVLVMFEISQPARTIYRRTPSLAFKAVVAAVGRNRSELRSACDDDYHSNRGVWGCYSRIAPIFVFRVNDVKRGRAYPNHSQVEPRHFRR